MGETSSDLLTVVSFHNENVLKLELVMTVAQLCEYTKMY